MLESYKKILASILPEAMLTPDGVLKTPAGRPESMTIISPSNRSVRKESGWLNYARRFLGTFFPKECDEECDGRSFYDGRLYEKVLRWRVAKREDCLTQIEYDALNEWAEKQIAAHASRDVISTLNSVHKGVLAHETFHDIQGFLLDHHPAVFENLLRAIDTQRARIANWMA